MKKLPLFVAPCAVAAALIVCSILLGSCHKKNCQGLVYDNPPALSDTGYNTCKAIYYNFYMYNGNGNGDGLDVLRQMEGSMMKVCGYIHTHVDPDRNHYTLADTPQQSGERPEIELKIDYLGVLDTIEIDGTKKYYLTGSMGFISHPYHGNDFGACLTYIPRIWYIHEYNME